MFSARKDFQAIVLPADANHLLDPAVIRFKPVIRQRPVFLDTVHEPPFKIPFRVAESNGIPMDSPAADHPDSVDAHLVRVL